MASYNFYLVVTSGTTTVYSQRATLDVICGPSSLNFVRPGSFIANQERVISSGEEYFSFEDYLSSIHPSCSSFTYTVQISETDGTLPIEIKNTVAQPEFIDGENRIYLRDDSLSEIRTVTFVIRITENGGYLELDGPLTVELVCGEVTAPFITQSMFLLVQNVVMR